MRGKSKFPPFLRDEPEKVPKKTVSFIAVQILRSSEIIMIQKLLLDLSQNVWLVVLLFPIFIVARFFEPRNF
jgi:hypothetical protein